MIVYKTNMEEIPKNCKDCTFVLCSLPLKKNTCEPIIKKEYEKKRHKECPLIETE